jgi:hypothetical protein
MHEWMVLGDGKYLRGTKIAVRKGFRKGTYAR